MLFKLSDDFFAVLSAIVGFVFLTLPLMIFDPNFYLSFFDFGSEWILLTPYPLFGIIFISSAIALWRKGKILIWIGILSPIWGAFVMHAFIVPVGYYNLYGYPAGVAEFFLGVAQGTLASLFVSGLMIVNYLGYYGLSLFPVGFYIYILVRLFRNLLAQKNSEFKSAAL